MKKSTVWIIGVIGIIALLIFLRQWNQQGIDNKMTANKVKPAILVEGRILKPTASSNIINVSGTIMSNEEVMLQSQIAGVVTKVLFTEGSHVNQGDLLVKIDDAQFQAQLQKDEVLKQLDSITERRQKANLVINAISEQDYDIALNNLNAVKADMKLIQVSIGYTNIRAPFDGIIGLKNISNGSYVTPNVVIANLEETVPVKVDFYIPEKYISQIQKEDIVNFSVTGYSETFQGKVFAIDPKVDMSTGSIHVRAIYENKDRRLFPGQFATVSIVLSHSESSIMIPTEAVIPKVIGQNIYIYKNGKVASVPISLGIRTDSMVEITKGLHLGDTIITRGTQLIYPNSIVKFNSLH
jgi:membrane fusion protein (multidrug efflux system)